MSDREIDIKVGEGQQSTAVGLSQASDEADPFPIEGTDKEKLVWNERQKAHYKKHRLARVLDRGFTIDRLTVDLPKHLWGEWVPNTPSDLARANLLGFVEDKEYATRRGLHDGGDGSARVGDVTFMVQPIWMHEALEEEKARIYYETHLKPRQKEEKDAVAMISDQLGLPVNVNSIAENVKGTALTETMLQENTSIKSG